MKTTELEILIAEPKQMDGCGPLGLAHASFSLECLGKLTSHGNIIQLQRTSLQGDGMQV